MARKVVLRETKDSEGYRYLDAVLQDSGDLVFNGQDLGDGVERFFGEGNREYEWIWTVKAENVLKLAVVLGSPDDLVAAIGERFSGAAAAGLSEFLKTAGVSYETWSRVGD